MRPTVADRVTVDVSGINVEFDSFNFDLEKVLCYIISCRKVIADMSIVQVTFPKVKDNGLAIATSAFSANVSFDVVGLLIYILSATVGYK